MRDVEIAIIGGGIGGLTTALALSRKGLDCEVFEQTAELRGIGAGVQIAPNATRFLHRLGLAERLAEVAIQPVAVRMRRWKDNALLLEVPLGPHFESLFGAPYYTVHRGDLHRVLMEAAEAVPVHLGKRLTGVENLADSVSLSFKDGSEVRSRVVIGADGIHSRVRDAIARDHPRYSGMSVYRGLVPAERIPELAHELSVTVWVGPGQHSVCYPVSSDRLHSFAAVVPIPHWAEESWTSPGRKEDLLSAFAGWNESLISLFTAADSVSQWALHDREPLERWGLERLTVLGDAAHPMLPFLAQGVNQAVEDAAVLSSCLTDVAGDDFKESLRRYEHLRRPRATQIQEISTGNEQLYHLPDGDDQRRRDAEFASETGVGGLDLARQEWLYAYDAEAAVLADSA